MNIYSCFLLIAWCLCLSSSHAQDSETWQRNCSSMWTDWYTTDPDSTVEYRSQFCGEISSKGNIRNWELLTENRTRLDTETWRNKCSSLWTEWCATDTNSPVEYRARFCGEISSKGNIRNWELLTENRTKLVSSVDASFRSKKKFTKTLLDKSSDDFKTLRDEFLPLLRQAYKKSKMADRIKDILVTGFSQGSTVVHFRVILTASVSVTDPLINQETVSKVLFDYLEANPQEARKYGSYYFQDQGVALLTLIVTLTVISLLVIVIIVLAVFFVRLKRRLPESPGGAVSFHVSREAAEHAGLGERSEESYQTLGQKKQCDRKTNGGQTNYAFGADGDATYMYVVAGAPDAQGGQSEDGYRGDGNEEVAATEEGAVYSNANDNAALPSKNKPDGSYTPYSAERDPAHPTVGDHGAEATSLEKNSVITRQNDESADDDYATAYAHAPYRSPDVNMMIRLGETETNVKQDNTDAALETDDDADYIDIVG